MGKRFSPQEMGELIKSGEAIVQPDTPKRFSPDDMMAMVEKGEAKAVDSNYHQGIFDSPTMDSLRNGILLGYGPQFEAAMEYIVGHASGNSDLVDPYTVRRDRAMEKYEKHKATNPKTWAAGNVGGAVMGAIPAAGLTAVKGATGLQRLASAAKVGGAYGAISNPGDTKGELSGLQLGERAKNALTGAATGAVVQGGLEGLGSASRGIKGLKKDIGQYISDNSAVKQNTDDIIQSSRNLGFEPTPGMLAKKGTVISPLESSLEQSPGLGGWMTRKSTEKVRKGLSEGVEEVTEASTGSMTPYEVGEKIKSLIVSDTGERLAPATMVMDDLMGKFGQVPVKGKSLKAVGNNLRNLKEIKLRPKEGFASTINNLADDLDNVGTLADIRMIRQSVGEQLAGARASGDRNAAGVLSQAYKKLSALEQRSLKQGIIDLGRGTPGAKEAAVNELSSLRSANKLYSKEMGEIGEFAAQGKLGKAANPDQFMRNVEKIPSEQLGKRFGNVNDLGKMKAMEGRYPEGFEAIRQRKLMELFEKSNLSDGSISSPKLINQTTKIPRDAKQMLFKDKLGKLGDLETASQAYPSKLGGSDTPRGLSFYDYANPVMHAKDLGRYGAYKGLTSETGKKLGQKWSQIDPSSKVQNALGDGKTMGGLMGGVRENLIKDDRESPLMNDQRLFNMIQKNPSLIDGIQNEKLKAKLREYVEGSPSFTKKKVDVKEAQDQFVEGN